MRTGLHLPRRDRRRAVTLAVIIVLQALCAAFFVSDIVSDFGAGNYGDTHLKVEAAATLVLLVGVIFLMVELRGVMAEIIDTFFDEWKLTPSEKDVGLLILKGFDNEAIASIRGTAAGTIRAQSTRIYAKAGVDGRAQLFSVLLEELLADENNQTREEVAR